MKEERKKNGKSHPVVLPSVQAAHNLDPSMSRPYAVVGGSSDTPLKPQLIIVVLFGSISKSIFKFSSWRQPPPTQKKNHHPNLPH